MERYLFSFGPEIILARPGLLVGDVGGVSDGGGGGDAGAADDVVTAEDAEGADGAGDVDGTDGTESDEVEETDEEGGGGEASAYIGLGKQVAASGMEFAELAMNAERNKAEIRAVETASRNDAAARTAETMYEAAAGMDAGLNALIRGRGGR